MKSGALIVTTENISGKRLEALGLVQGTVIKTRNAFVDIGQGFRMLWGGKMGAYTKMMETARAEATELMVKQAKSLGADAIVAVRYSTSSVVSTASEILVYGTAVKFKSQSDAVAAKRSGAKTGKN